MKISLRELFGLVAFVAFAIGGLLSGPPLAWIGLIAFVLLWLTKLVDCFVCRGPRQSFSVGFTIFAAFYLGLCVYLGSSEFFAFNYDQAKLPTSRLVYVCLKPEYTPSQTTNATKRNNEQLRAKNGRCLFPLGHLATACMLGYIGGCYARFVTRDTDMPQSA